MSDYFKKLCLLGFTPEQARHIPGGDWRTWTPTYGGGNDLTYTSVTTTRSGFLILGNTLLWFLRATGTTDVSPGGTDGANIRATLPLGLTLSTGSYGGICYVRDNTRQAGYFEYSATNINFYKIDLAVWGIGTNREIRGMGFANLR